MELGEAIEQARRLIRDCESVARLKAPIPFNMHFLG